VLASASQELSGKLNKQQRHLSVRVDTLLTGVRSMHNKAQVQSATSKLRRLLLSGLVAVCFVVGKP